MMTCRPIFYSDSITRVTTSTVPTDIPSVDPGTDSSFIDTFATWYTAATVTIFSSFSPRFSQDEPMGVMMNNFYSRW